MEKKKEKADLEQLLNTLIEKGWKPRWLDRIKWGIIYCWPKWWITFQHKGQVFDFWCPDYVLYNWKEYMDYDSYIIYFADDVFIDTKHIFGYRKLLRELCSKESWLWQFVCENGMVYYNDESIYSPMEYRIIQSALTDEDKLEDFILSNIKLD